METVLVSLKNPDENPDFFTNIQFEVKNHAVQSQYDEKINL